ncbi:AraC family transcriptional regulator [Pseudoalteromonas citrea]|uniref:AraC family transcriptional regulator n=1 Tax=Pseudoalteromonas citrea TaxID=43655 RepID=A0A5S3XM75_9GAMM|nr:helix-turn-helix domain-containing protein [Pseudoalteromonas citrea]TMP40152.1 AraC family transcriptional regulator [Pseudoalteromonas citrea]TMP56866.1 AraC family transcriptional regulator [Pseudoalteromonas citrea]
MTKKLLFFIADGFQALDLFGPLDAFMETNSFVSEHYSSQLFSLRRGEVKSTHGQKVLVEYKLDDVLDVDYLIICGGAGMRTLTLNNAQTKQLRNLADSAKKVMSICTGSFILAQLYRDKALNITTHWRHCNDLASRANHCDVSPDPLYIEEQGIWSSAGVLSGVDLALAVIRSDHGNVIAAKVAKELVVYLQRSSHQSQFSDLLAIQSNESLRLSPLLDWLIENIASPCTVAEMAEVCALSERQLTRLFKTHLNTTPSQYFKKLRLDRAKDLMNLEHPNLSLIASQVGFKSYDSFRRAFMERFGISPSHYLINH